MGNGKITKELKGLGLKINETEPNGETVSEVIKGIADDYEGGTGGTTVVANPTLAGTEDPLTGLEVDGTKYAVVGGKKYYRHYMLINFGADSDIFQIIGIIENTSPSAITVNSENDLIALMTEHVFNTDSKILNAIYGNGVEAIPSCLLYNNYDGWKYASYGDMSPISYAFTSAEDEVIVEL